MGTLNKLCFKAMGYSSRCAADAIAMPTRERLKQVSAEAEAAAKKLRGVVSQHKPDEQAIRQACVEAAEMDQRTSPLFQLKHFFRKK
eukprot:8793201-Alexandrium_andersonii.AAC.1